MTIEDYERIVRRAYPRAFVFLGQNGGWSICNGYSTPIGNISIPGVGFHATIVDAWQAATLVVEQSKGEVAK